MWKLRLLALAVLGGVVSCQSTRPPTVATFSIAAVDGETGEIGVAVASRVPAVGAIVPFVEAEVGAVATQAKANVVYGPRGLELLRLGLTAQEVLEFLAKEDSEADRRQVGIVSADGASASRTGTGCFAWAGGRTGPGYAIQGNILEGPGVLEAMEQAYLESVGELLPDRLLLVLQAGDSAGGDRRGKQSAALLVNRKGWGYAGLDDRFRDLRVDDHKDPVAELGRILKVHRGVFRRPGRVEGR